jgi:putative SOS response-associated peptidase YedK
MCGRFYYGENIDVTPYVRILERNYDQTILNLWQHGETAPSQVCLTLTAPDQPQLMRWHYLAGSHPIINTRIESLQTNPLFVDDFKLRRCVIIASGFYEWDAGHQRYYITSNTGQPIYLAGLYQTQKDLSGFSIITKPATTTKAIHSRTPAVLNQDQATTYLTKFDQAYPLIQQVDPQLAFQLTGPVNLSLF